MTGAVEGIVVDEETLPVEGAAVGLLADPSTRTDTDGGGRFRLVLAPGLHELLVQKDGYKHGALEVNVIAGEITKARIILKAAPLAVPREVRFPYNGYLGFDLAVPSGNQFGPGPAGDVQRSVYYNIEQPDLVGVFAAAVWTGNLPSVSDRLHLLIYLNIDRSQQCDDAARTYCLPMATTEGRSPIANGSNDYQENMRERENLRVNVRFRMRPCVTADVGTSWVNPARCATPAELVKLAVDQRVSVYTVMFYGQPAPPGFSAVPA
ncbi:MAG: carboxypeptidase regulatory-like domain-containing protein [Euryarchaeota archaeon]|nr:carboxypeptidase regulatory-like domain-containing protein [Euryarchaeota archaeon]